MPIVLKPHELKLRQQAGEYDEPTCIRGASGVYYGTEEPEDYQINVWVNPEGTVTKTMESPILTGIPTAPTASPHTDTTQIATTEFVMNEVENKIESTDIVDNLTTNDSSKPLSAAQGYVLNNNKVNKTDIADNLTTNDATKVLSAAQGYAIKEELDEKAAAIYDIDSGFTHEDVSAIEIVGNSYAFGTARYADKKNLIERDTDTTGASGTVTYQLKRNVVILNGERTGGGNDSYFAEYETDIPAGNYIFKVEPYVGNSTLTNGKNLHIDLWYDNNLSSTYDMRVTLNSVKDVPVSKTFTTTSHVYKIRVWFGFTTNVYDDYRMFYTLFPSDVNIVDTNQILGPSSTLEVVLPSSMSVVDTMMHSSNVYTIVDTKTYIDNKTPEIDFVYFRPEDYGAVGNGVADDSVALQACINAAQQYSENVGKAIRGFGSYKISTGIVFNCRELDVFLNKIIYTGNDAAVTLSASFSRFMFHSVRAFDGGTNTVCFRVTQTQDSGFTSTYYGNELTCDFARSKGNVLEVTEAQGLTYHSIMYNKVSFRQARSDNANIVNIQAFTFNETDFSCKIPIANNGFLVHYEASASNSAIRVHDSCLEADLANGTNGQVDFIDCRFAEMENLQTSSDRTKGRIFAWDGNRLAAGSIVGATSGIDLVALDVSNARSYEDCLDEVKALYLSGKTTSQAFMSALRYTNVDEFAKIECVARTANANMNENNSMMNIAHGSAIVYYNNLAFKPYNEIYHKVDADMTIELSAENNWSYLTPTVFDINAAEVDINLDASYCCLTINQFDVIQYANKKAIVYDKFGNQIFDGTKYGAGTYRFKCSFVPYEYGEVYIELDNGTHVNCNATLLPSLYSGYNEKWSVIRLDRIGTDADTNYGPDTYVTPEDFGAKGDGVADDSTAFQTAVNACDDLYLESNKTYYLGSEVTVNNSIRIHGGKNTIIKTKTPSGGVVNNGIIAQGTLKLTTTLSSNYVAYGDSGDNIGNKLTLESDTNVAIGDIIVVQATDQYYSYARQYYYLGAAMLITDTDGTSFYVNEGMPFDITKTANLTVKVYSAPKVVFENIRFESDHTSGSSGAYIYPLTIQRCGMPEVRNCSFANANNGLLLRECYGALVENVTIEKIKEDNTVGYDGYGCAVYGCMNTTFRKVTGQGGQSTIDMSGTITNINTWIKECDLMGECRTGLGMHENAYNTVVEDSIIAGATMYGTVTFNRCTFVENPKLTGTANVSFRGSHNPEWAKIKFKDCVFPKRESVAIVLAVPACQTPIQSFDSVIGRVEITNCEGGRLQYNSTLDQYILSSKVKELIIDGWKDCYDIYHTDPNTIDVCIIRNSTFTHSPWMDKHTTAFWLDGVSILRRINDYPQMDRLLVKLARGGRFYLPEDVNISFSSSDTSARYLVCGENIASNNPADYNIGGLSGSAGSALTKTVNSTFSSALSVNSNGNLVLTYPNVTSNVAVYPTCMAYIKERSVIKMTCKLVNSGSTSASSFRACLCIIDAKTGNIVYRSNGQSAEATAAGVVVTHERDVPEDSLVFGYIQCYSGVALSETTFEDFAVKVLPVEFDEGAISFTPYVGSSITGDGTIKSLSGQNNIMADSSSAFAISFRADLLQRGS